MDGCLRKLVIAFFVALILAVFLSMPVFYVLGKPEARALSIERIHAEEGIPVEVVRPVRMDFTAYTYCDGDVVADVRAMLRSKIPESVQAVHARPGEGVKRDQIVVEFRSTDIEADIEAARAAKKEADQNLKRIKGLFEEKVISQDRLDQALTRKKAAGAALVAAESRLTFTVVRSPIDGVVESRMVEPGEYKDKGKELLSIVDLSTVEVRALVAEQDLSGLTAGKAGEFQLESSENWLEGAISRISPSTADPNRFFDVYLKVQNPQTDGAWLMRPGMYVEVRFKRGVFDDVPGVPGNTLLLEGDSQVVYLAAAVTESVPVQVEQPQAREAGGVVARIKRGAGRAANRLSARSRGGPGAMATSEPATREARFHRARRMVVATEIRERGFVRLSGDPLSPEALVIANPRDAIKDGARVKIVKGRLGDD